MSAATIQTPILASQLREMADSLNSPHGGAIRTADIISLLYSAAEALSNRDAKYPDAIRDSLEQDWRELEATCTRLEEQQRRDGYRAGLLWWIVLLAALGGACVGRFIWAKAMEQPRPVCAAPAALRQCPLGAQERRCRLADAQ